MKRRVAVTWLGLLLAGGPASRAQSPRRPRIGLLVVGTSATDGPRIAALRRGLAEHGYVEPDTLELVIRFADGDAEQFAALARELVAARVDVIVTGSTSAVRAVAGVTRTIPIVSATSSDLLAGGVVTSLARPEGNVTGLSQARLETGSKEVELAAELLAGIVRVAVLRGPAGGAGVRVLDAMRAAASSRGIDLRDHQVATAGEIEVAFAAMAAGGAQVAIVIDGPLTNAQRERVARLGIAHRLPVISSSDEFVAAGTLASYGPDTVAMYRRAAYFVDRLLKGAKPGDLPIEQPTKFALVINLKTAKALGVTVPQFLLLRADEVIE